MFNDYNYTIRMIQINYSLYLPINNKTLTHFITEPVEIYLPSIITTTILLIIISIIGTIGNSFVVWAFIKQVKQGIISGLFILLLACNDLFICLIIIPCTLYLDIWTGDTTDWICRIHLTMKGFVVPISACILMLIAIERFLLICFIPGIQMQRIHIIISLIIILCIGLLCAIPMGLHVHAIDLFKQRDELLDLNTLKYGLSNIDNNEWLHQLRVTKRCDKDDTYINDQFYWYYQICVLLLFIILFLSIASIYSLIFLFVWKHESFMYEKYGNSKLKGNWIRIHATPNSSGDFNEFKWYSIKKHRSLRKKLKQSNDLYNKQNERQQLELETLEQHKQSSLEQLTSLSQSQSYLKQQQEQQQEQQQQQQEQQQEQQQQQHEQQQEQEQHEQQEEQQQPLEIHQTFTDITTSTSFIISNLDRINCVCLCETNNRNELIPMNLYSTYHDQLLNNNNIHPNNDNEELPSNKTIQTMLEFNHKPQLLLLSSSSSTTTRMELSIVNLEHKRKSHIRTAQTLALIAINFIISYTPYLIYTTIPIQKRQIILFKEKLNWTIQIRRILFYMYFINSALNPIIYSCMNRHFRLCLIKFYTKLKKKLKK